MSLSQTGNNQAETGLLPGRYEWVPEPSPGEVPTDPAFRILSDAVRTFGSDGGASMSAQQTTGSADAQDHFRGMEGPSYSVEYDLQRFPVSASYSDPSSASTLGVQSTDSGDTDIDVTIYGASEATSETITTDGTDGTTFVAGSTSFSTVERVVVKADTTGAIEVYVNNSGTAGTKLGEEPATGTVYPNPQAVDPTGYGMLRDSYNRLPATLMLVGRKKLPGGNDGAGIRRFIVIRGAPVADLTATLDPSSEQPILAEGSGDCRKVRSYLIHQPASSTTVSVSSTSANDTMDLTVENEGAGTTETITLTGTSTASGSTSFADIDALWLSENPEGTVTITDGSGTTLAVLEGGNTYSDDDQPVDGDRGVPLLGAGSHGAALGTTFEHFIGDRFERPSGSAVRPRVNSASWAVENDIETSSLHDTRAPPVDEGNRTVSVDADVGGPYVSHRSMMDALQRDQADLEHELMAGTIVFKNTTPTSSGSPESSADQAVVSISETLTASGEPALEFKS